MIKKKKKKNTDQVWLKKGTNNKNLLNHFKTLAHLILNPLTLCYLVSEVIKFMKKKKKKKKKKPVCLKDIQTSL